MPGVVVYIQKWFSSIQCTQPVADVMLMVKAANAASTCGWCKKNLIQSLMSGVLREDGRVIVHVEFHWMIFPISI